MGSCYNDVCIENIYFIRRLSNEQPFEYLRQRPSDFFPISLVAVLVLVSSSAANATGDAAKGQYNWEYTCQHCHGNPQTDKNAAFSDYGTTANRLAVYANDPAAITKSANEGYTVPDGNTNDKVDPGKNTNEPMGTWAGMAPNRLGLGTTPTQYAIDFAAYFATFFDAPSAPTISSISAGNAQATISFTVPKSDLTITGYTVTADPGGQAASGTASPITVTGLSNGASYTFTVKATSNAGTGRSSSSSDKIMLAQPVATVATAVVRSAPAIVTPVNVGGSNKAAPAPNTAVPTLPATAAQVTGTANQVTQASAAKTPSAISAAPTVPHPVQPGTVVTSTAAYSNNVAQAKASSPISPVSQATNLGAPTIKFAKAGNAQARVFFEVPAAVASITGYTVNALSNGAPTGITAKGTSSPITVSGLTNGTEYTFTISANSKAGSSAASLPSNVVTPLHILGD